MSRGPGLLAHGEFISLSSAQKRKKCYPKKQQGAGTVCASPAKHRLTVCRSPLIALSRISNSTMGLHRTCHFCTLIDALKQTEVSHGKQSLRKLKKKKRMTKLGYIYSSWLMAGVLRGVLGSAQELYPHIAGHRGSGCCRPGTQCEGSLAQGKIKVFVQSCREFQWKRNIQEDSDCLRAGGIQFQVWSRSDSSQSDPHTPQITSTQNQSTRTP